MKLSTREKPKLARDMLNQVYTGSESEREREREREREGGGEGEAAHSFCTSTKHQICMILLHCSLLIRWITFHSHEHNKITCYTILALGLGYKNRNQVANDYMIVSFFSAYPLNILQLFLRTYNLQ